VGQMNNILVLDDDRLTIKLITILLESFGYSAHCIMQSGILFEILDKHPIDLILLDVYLPGISGISVLEQLKNHDKYKDIPVIMLTADTDDRTLEQCLEIGAVDYINKPLREKVLKARIKSAISNRAYIKELKRLNTQMAEFVGIVSHDLRNPACGINMFCKMLANKELLQKAPYTEDEIVQTLIDKSQKSLDLITDLLDVTAMEAGRVKIDLEAQNFSEIMDNCIQNAMYAAAKKEITLINHSIQAPPVLVDKNRITQVLDNLIFNAIKFTPRGGKVELRSIQEDEGLKIVVVDTGIGVTNEIKDKLFNKHEKTSTLGTEGETGTGFGLPLAQELIQAHSSKIFIENNADQGSTFYFTIPWASQK